VGCGVWGGVGLRVGGRGVCGGGVQVQGGNREAAPGIVAL